MSFLIENEIPSLKKVKKIYSINYWLDYVIFLISLIFFISYAWLIQQMNFREYKGFHIQSIILIIIHLLLFVVLSISTSQIALKLMNYKTKKIETKNDILYQQIEKEYQLFKNKNLISKNVSNILETMIEKQPIVKNIVSYLQLEIENDEIYTIQKNFEQLKNTVQEKNMQTSKIIKI